MDTTIQNQYATTDHDDAIHDDASDAPARVERSRLYDNEVTNFAKLLGDDRDAAYRRYGYTILYSLPDEQYVRERRGLGFEPRMGLDYFNMGALANAEGDHKQAIEHYRAALEQGCDYPAVHYNLALSYETLGQTGEARTEYEAFVQALQYKGDLTQDEMEDMETVKAHLARL